MYVCIKETAVSELCVSELNYLIRSFDMNFYNREKEIETLLSIQKRSLANAQMTVVTGRRRIGKTQLLLKATEGQTTLYFFVARKAESFLCQDFAQEIKDKLGIPILGEINSFGELFKFLMEFSKTQPFNLIIDEFQEFYTIAPSVYSDIQHYWDVNKDQSKMNLLLSGSVYSLMHKIFQNSKEPLFGRATALLRVKPFETSVLKEILADHHPDYTPEDLLALYAFTGGVAKYVQLLMDSGSHTLKAMLDYIIKEDSTFVPEGKNMLVEEFGKEYTNYFTILSAIARGENTRAKIEAVVNREVGGYLTKLEHDYGLIAKVTPIFAKVETKNVRYVLEDNFLTFWFRFIYKYSYMVEIGGYGQLKEVVTRDYPTFSGKILERYFRALQIEQMRFTRIGGYWDRKGENEIDMIAVNELDRTADVIEIKRNAANINLDKLKEKGAYLMKATGELGDYKVAYKGLSMNDM